MARRIEKGRDSPLFCTPPPEEILAQLDPVFGSALDDPKTISGYKSCDSDAAKFVFDNKDYTQRPIANCDDSYSKAPDKSTLTRNTKYGDAKTVSLADSHLSNHHQEQQQGMSSGKQIINGSLTLMHSSPEVRVGQNGRRRPQAQRLKINSLRQDHNSYEQPSPSQSIAESLDMSKPPNRSSFNTKDTEKKTLEEARQEREHHLQVCRDSSRNFPRKTLPPNPYLSEEIISDSDSDDKHERQVRESLKQPTHNTPPNTTKGRPESVATVSNIPLRPGASTTNAPAPLGLSQNPAISTTASQLFSSKASDLKSAKIQKATTPLPSRPDSRRMSLANSKRPKMKGGFVMESDESEDEKIDDYIESTPKVSVTARTQLRYPVSPPVNNNPTKQLNKTRLETLLGRKKNPGSNQRSPQDVRDGTQNQIADSASAIKESLVNAPQIYPTMNGLQGAKARPAIQASPALGNSSITHRRSIAAPKSLEGTGSGTVAPGQVVQANRIHNRTEQTVPGVSKQSQPEHSSKELAVMRNTEREKLSQTAVDAGKRKIAGSNGAISVRDLGGHNRGEDRKSHFSLPASPSLAERRNIPGQLPIKSSRRNSASSSKKIETISSPRPHSIQPELRRTTPTAFDKNKTSMSVDRNIASPKVTEITATTSKFVTSTLQKRKFESFSDAQPASSPPRKKLTQGDIVERSASASMEWSRKELAPIPELPASTYEPVKKGKHNQVQLKARSSSPRPYQIQSLEARRWIDEDPIQADMNEISCQKKSEPEHVTFEHDEPTPAAHVRAPNVDQKSSLTEHVEVKTVEPFDNLQQDSERESLSSSNLSRLGSYSTVSTSPAINSGPVVTANQNSERLLCDRSADRDTVNAEQEYGREWNQRLSAGELSHDSVASTSAAPVEKTMTESDAVMNEQEITTNAAVLIPEEPTQIFELEKQNRSEDLHQPVSPTNSSGKDFHVKEEVANTKNGSPYIAQMQSTSRPSLHSPNSVLPAEQDMDIEFSQSLPSQTQTLKPEHAYQTIYLPDPVLKSDAEPYWEYSVLAKHWSSMELESAVLVHNNVSQPTPNIDSANAAAEQLFHAAMRPYQPSILAVSIQKAETDEHGCIALSATVAPADRPHPQYFIKYWVQRNYVPDLANVTPRELGEASFISSTVYLLRLFKLGDAAVSSDTSSSSDDGEDDTEPIRIYHATNHPQVYTNLPSANRAARDLQVELSHAENPSCGMTAAWQEQNARDLNAQIRALDAEQGYWSSKFNGSGRGGDQFELVVEPAGIRGPRNI